MEYSVVRSKRKTLALTFDKEGMLQVKAPLYVTDRVIEAFVLKHRKWIEAHASVARQKATEQKQYTPARIREMKQQTKNMILPLVEQYASLMAVRPAKVSVTSARTRFGSCNSKGNICFSFLLCLYPMEAVEYVVVHELAHLVHHDHSASFHALVAKYLPDEKSRRAILRNKGGQPS